MELLRSFEKKKKRRSFETRESRCLTLLIHEIPLMVHLKWYIFEFLLKEILCLKAYILLQLYPLEGATSIEKYDTFAEGVSLAKHLLCIYFRFKKKKRKKER